jgi:hypothetical protein
MPAQTGTKSFLICIVVGVVLASVCSVAGGALGLQVKDDNGGLVHGPRPALEKESAVKLISLGPGVGRLDKDRRSGSVDLLAEESGLSLDEYCSTDVVLAVFFKSRSCKGGTLIVAVTSELNDEANLVLLDYGPMKWDSTNQIWFIRIRDLEINPGLVLVVGAECTRQASILTLPFGCDARLPTGIGDGS